jgi:hypothetical protein
MGFWQIETKPEPPLQSEAFTLIPFTQRTGVQLPGREVRWLWQRPTSILVQRPDGSEEVIPVVDTQRNLLLAILAAGLATGLVFWQLGRRRD